tara:strand:- start:975 stop:1730 length:756 start_codon:yes stop_codon:yes gene_type:complete
MEYTNQIDNINYKQIVNNDVLYVGETVVSIKTNIDFKAILIKHKNDFSCSTLLPNSFIIKKTDNKILILKINNEKYTDLDLFTYRGVFTGHQVDVYGDAGLITNLHINRDTIVSWDNLTPIIDKDGNKTEQAWENLSTWYEKMSFDGRNNYINALVSRPIILDEDATQDVMYKKLEYKEYYEKQIPLTNGLDEYSEIVGGLYTSGNAYKIKGSKNSYSGFYHYHIRTKKVMTGKHHTQSSEELVKYKSRKV